MTSRAILLPTAASRGVDDDDNDDSSLDQDETGVAGLSLGRLAEFDWIFVDFSWRVPLFNVSREVASHPSDEAGLSRNTFIDPSEHAELIKRAIQRTTRTTTTIRSCSRQSRPR